MTTALQLLDEGISGAAVGAPLYHRVRPHWWLTKDGDLDCLDRYLRHYSAYHYADQRERKLFVGPGEKVVLRTERGDAFFVWRKFVDDCIDQRTGQRQHGINCAAFRNESGIRSSSLVEQADRIADALWPGGRHYTYVNGAKVRSVNPGFCFLAAGWRRAGMTKGGLHVLERVVRNNALDKRSTTAGRQARAGENVPRTARPDLVVCR